MNRIKELRLARGMKQTDLAQAVSVSQAALSGYETGKYEPDFDTLKKLAAVLGVSVDYLLGGSLSDEKKEPATVSGDGQAEKLAQGLRQLGIDVDKLTDAEISRIARLAKAALEE